MQSEYFIWILTWRNELYKTLIRKLGKFEHWLKVKKLFIFKDIKRHYNDFVVAIKNRLLFRDT